jgi:DNA-binding YbaB/EbfC family protein
MSDPFGGLGGMGGLLGGFQKQMQQLQAEAEREEVEATAGSLVTVRMNGAQEVLSVRIDPKAMDDRELVEDLLRAATNEAVRRSKQVVAAKLGQLAAAMGLPPGLLG